MTQENVLPDHVSDPVRRLARTVSVGRRRTARYLAIFLAPILIAALILATLYAFLLRVEETTGPISAARLQDETGTLYGPALVYRPFAYKLERYRLKSPDILLVGSSRVMPFAGEVFSGSVINAGGAANTLDQAVTFTRAAVAIHKPTSILLGLDFWWFNPNRDDEIDATGTLSDEVEISLTQLMTPVQWVADDAIHLSSFLEGLSPFHDLPHGIGAFAKFGGRGWDVYGRYDYGTLIDGGMKNDDKQFKRTLKRLQSAKKSSKMNVHVAPSAQSLQQLRDLVRELEAQSIEVILLVTPLAGPVQAAMDQDSENRLVPLWRDALGSIGARLFDFSDAGALGSSDCEFVDGFHGGEVTYLRILDAIGTFGGTALGQAIDRDMVTGLIASNAGHARLRELRPGDVPPEIDFLDLGCDKGL